MRGMDEVMTMMVYIAQDGNYGDAGGLAICDGAHWTEADWDALDAMNDTMRSAYAYYYKRDHPHQQNPAEWLENYA